LAYERIYRGVLPVICLGRRRLASKVALLALVGQSTVLEASILSAPDVH
jgi:hypothetical protein